MAPAPWPRHGGHKADLGHGRSHGMSHGVTGLPVTQKGGQQLPSQRPTLSAGGHVLRFPREEGQSPGTPLSYQPKKERESQGCSAGVGLGSAWGQPGGRSGRQRRTQAEGWPPLTAVAGGSKFSAFSSRAPSGQRRDPSGQAHGRQPRLEGKVRGDVGERRLW